VVAIGELRPGRVGYLDQQVVLTGEDQPGRSTTGRLASSPRVEDALFGGLCFKRTGERIKALKTRH
jgi:hypothetical protein